jgi:SNF2 family DNA or RNA helicase
MSRPNERKQRKLRARRERIHKRKVMQASSANADMLRWEVENYHRNQDWRPCAEACRKYLSLFPNCIPVLEIYGSALSILQNRPMERSVAQKIFELSPKDPRYFRNLLGIEQDLGNHAEVLRLIAANPESIKRGNTSRYRDEIQQFKSIAEHNLRFAATLKSAQAGTGAQDTTAGPSVQQLSASAIAMTPHSLGRTEPRLRVVFDEFVLDLNAQENAADSPSTLFWLRQRLRREHIRMQQEFEELLCLAELRNVEHLGYQVETARKALRVFRGRVLLADEVGLGKTVEACMIAKEYLLRGMVKSILVLCPPALVNQWVSELSTKFGIRAQHQTSVTAPGKHREWFWSRDIVVVSLHTAKGDAHFDYATRREWDMVIVDEAHHLKNRRTLAWKFVNEIRKKFILLLSATPVQNNLTELYNLITLLKPGTFPPESEFKKQYINPRDPRMPVNTEKLRLLIRDVMIRNTRAACGVAFSKRFATTVSVGPSPPEREIYARISELCREIYDRAEPRLKTIVRLAIERAGAHLPGAIRPLQSIAANLAKRLPPADDRAGDLPDRLRLLAESAANLPVRTAKIDALIELLLANDRQKIVFCRYAASIDHIAAALLETPVRYSMFHGGLTPEKKEESLAEFKDGESTVLLSSESGGEGHNLQFCSTIINFDLPWNPMQIEQRIGRVHRIGQKNDVFVFNLCGAETLEQKILDILEKKIRMFELVIGEVDAIVGRLDEQGGFENVVFDLWMRPLNEQTREHSFNRLGDELGQFIEADFAAAESDANYGLLSTEMQETSLQNFGL